MTLEEIQAELDAFCNAHDIECDDARAYEIIRSLSERIANYIKFIDEDEDVPF